MVRTRDYFLLLVIIVFLVVAIGTTLISRYWSGGTTTETNVTFVLNASETFSASSGEDMSLARAERLDSMREKISKGVNLSIYEPPEITEEPEGEEIESESEDVTVASEIRCTNYHLVTTAWNPANITVVESEGARLVYKDTEPALSPTSTTSPASDRTIVLQLPLRSASLGLQSCVATDVIGITLGGTLIRNTDAKLYAPFAEGTILGYALDGFPIYGTSAKQTDSCGGVVVAGQYRYQLSPERDTIIQCYSGIPATI